MRDYWTRAWRIVDSHLRPLQFTTEPDGRIAVKVHQRLRIFTGILFNETEIEHVYQIENGLIQHLEIRKINEGQ